MVAYFIYLIAYMSLIRFQNYYEIVWFGFFADFYTQTFVKH
jgi:hypothetical protein